MNQMRKKDKSINLKPKDKTMRRQKSTGIRNNKSKKIGRLEDKFSKSEIEQFDADTELWESRKLGASAKDAKPVSDDQEQVLDDALGLQLISVRIQKSLIEQLRGLAKLEGMDYQTFMRQVLTRYTKENEHKLEELLEPRQLAEKAEQLFVQALEYNKMISTSKAMSNERIKAEHSYSITLSQANALFCQVYKNCNDPVLKKHVRLRKSQITKLCDERDNVPNKKLKRAG
jgi:predicted DNA binding CopG/RHH family protein